MSSGRNPGVCPGVMPVLRRLHYITALVLGLVLSPACPGQDTQDIYDSLQSLQQKLDDAIQQATDGEYGLAYELTTPEEFEQAITDFQAVLQDGDLEALARWLPEARDLQAGLDAFPELEPYADWLRQRLDYAMVADEAVRSLPPVITDTPATPETAPEQPVPDMTLPKPSTAAPVAPVADERLAFVRKHDTWSTQLAGRPAPEGSKKLVPVLKEIFQDQGVPPELVWMAEVESTFNPRARSPAGAVGLFQLIPSTAEHLGLELEPDDQRLDPSHNGRAAAQYLDYLHGRFEDWPLAIAAYNGGEGRVSKLLKANGASNLDGIADELPGETRMYVPKVFATIRLREGFDPLERW